MVDCVQETGAHMKPQYIQLLWVLLVTAVLTVCALAIRSVPLLAASSTSRNLYAVNQLSKSRGQIAVYDIDAGHRLIKTIHTVVDVKAVMGLAVSAVTGKLYVTYRNNSGVGMIYCVNVYNDVVLWNRAIDPGVDRLVPTAEAMALLDRIVRECKQVGRHVDAKRLRSLSPTIRARTKKHRGFSAMLG